VAGIMMPNARGRKSSGKDENNAVKALNTSPTVASCRSEQSLPTAAIFARHSIMPGRSNLEHSRRPVFPAAEVRMRVLVQ